MQQKSSESIPELKPKINPQLVKEYQKIFDSYDKEHDGYVQAKDVPSVLKILGVVCSQQQVVEMLGDRAIKSDNPLVSTKIDFTDFLAILVDKENQMAMKEELLMSFKVFDPQQNGMIPLSELRYYLRTYGLPISQEEVEQMLKESEPEDGYVKYQKFIDKMLERP